MDVQVKREPLPVKRLQFGEVVDYSFLLLMDNWRLMVTLALVVLLPVTLIISGLTLMLEINGYNMGYGLGASNTGAFPNDPGLIGLFVALMAAQAIYAIFFMPFFMTAVTYAIGMRFLGEPVTTPGVLRFSLRYYIFVLIMGIIYFFLLYLGFLFFIIPGVFVAIGFFVCLPVMLFEGTGPVEALRRSWNLVGGERGIVFALFFVLMPISMAATPWILLIPSGTAAAIINAVWGAVYLALTAILPTVYYFHARCRKEHLELDIAVREMLDSLPDEPQEAAL